MLFSSTSFLFAFLPTVLVLYFAVPFKDKAKEFKRKNLILCLASLIFYAWGEPVYIVLMIISILFNFVAGRDIQNHAGDRGAQRRILVFDVVFNLAMLGFFKYYAFAVSNINSLFGTDIKAIELALPVGISFYTFQALSYVIDVYKGVTRAQRRLLPFALYITMFPQLIAGPIVEYNDIAHQLESRPINVRRFASGILFFSRGLGKKVLFANYIGAIYSDITAGGFTGLSFVSAWTAVLCYTMQIYFDFSGYSDMAIGLGKMFGFDFVQNFNFPYCAISITDFWRRWHISLSTWFRDYVYIPLGGNRCSVPRNIFNILVVWSLTGLWHGAAWNFIIWGLYYALLLVLEKYVFACLLKVMPMALRRTLTMVLVMIGWVFFSSPTMTDAAGLLGSMFALRAGVFSSDSLYLIMTSFFPLLVCSLSAFGFIKGLPRLKSKSARLVAQTALYLTVFVLSIIYLVSETYNPFLYFRF